MPRPLLVTIAASHFCEKARWALEWAGVAFEEDGHLPLFHVPAVRRAGGTRMVPVLRTDDGVLSDSTDILVWADGKAPPERRLLPREAAARREVLDLEEGFDRRLGPDTRRWAYSFIRPSSALVRALASPGTPAWEQRVLAFTVPLVRAVIVRGLRIEPQRTLRSLGEIHRTFDAVGERLADGRRYLVGDRFSAADLTFASLAAPAVFPEGHPRLGSAIDVFPPASRAAIAAFREHPAGRFVQRLYTEERAC